MNLSALDREPVIRREVVTPEGVPLRFEIAPFGTRVYGFFVDFVLLFVLLFVMMLGLTFVAPFVGAAAAVLGIVVWFVLRHFFMILQELRWHGRTLGKRIARTRVVDREGGELTGVAICARNFTRDIEFWIPLQVVFFGPQVYGDLPGWIVPFCVIWAFGLFLFPVFNRDRMRLGDLVGGTVVVMEPRTRLLPDLAGASEEGEGGKPGAAPAAAPRSGTFDFSAEQLEIYGIYELQVLEELLRRPRVERKTLELVADKIKAKIAWDPARWRVDPRLFLEDFYRAQRARLEQKALFGRRQEYKRDREET